MLIKFFCQKDSSYISGSALLSARFSVSKQTSWPTAYISSIEPSGLMRIKFNQPMIVPAHPEYIQNETIAIDGKRYPVLEIKVLPGMYADPKKLNFNWTLINFTRTEFFIQLNFENKEYVSSNNADRDSIQITIYGFVLFVDMLANFMYIPTVLKPKVLPQLTSKDQIEQGQFLAAKSKQAMQGVATANTLVTIVLKGPIQQLLSSAKQL